MTPSSAMHVSPVSGSLGAEVSGLRLADLTDELFSTLESLWHEHLVLFFPEQDLSPDEHVQFARRFGEPEVHPFLRKLSEAYPEIVVLGADDKRADGWHTDVTFSPEPAMASVLNMVKCPQSGGDTMWTNQYLVYSNLTAPMRQLVNGLTAIHTAAVYGHPEMRTEHPLVRTHPKTGRKILFVNRGFTSHIPQLRPSESDALLDYLYSWSEQPEFQCRYRWREGTIAIWDNRCTQHCVVNDYDEDRRIERVTILGDAPEGSLAAWPNYQPQRASSKDRYRDAVIDSDPIDPALTKERVA